jgi:hypothetical protein
MGRGVPRRTGQETTTAGCKRAPEGYYKLYRRRLLPVLRHINAHATGPRFALVTILVLGCGQFAGPFQGELGARLQVALEQLLSEHGASLPNLKAVYFDPYGECENVRRENQIHGIAFMIRTLRAPSNQGKSQLCRQEAYEEPVDVFSSCALYSLVAGITSPGRAMTSTAGLVPPTTGSKRLPPVPMDLLTGVPCQSG